MNYNLSLNTTRLFLLLDCLKLHSFLQELRYDYVFLEKITGINHDIKDNGLENPLWEERAPLTYVYGPLNGW